MQWMRRARAPRLRSLIFPPNKKKDTARKTSFFFPCLISLSLFLIYFLFLKSSKRNEIIFNSCFYANSITWTESNTWIVSAMRRWSISDRESEIIARWPTPSRHFNSIYSRKFELSRRVPSSSIIRNTRGRDNCAPAPIIPPIFLFSFLAAEMEFFLKKSRRNRVSSSFGRRIWNDLGDDRTWWRFLGNYSKRFTGGRIPPRAVVGVAA